MLYFICAQCSATCLVKSRTAALQPRKVPSPLMSLTRRYSASVQSSIELRTPTPAAFRSPCRPPNLSTVAATALFHAVSSVTSRATKSAASPSSPASARPLASSRSASTALPPPRTTSRAVAAPMPEAPPLISTTLFSRRDKGLPPHQACGERAVCGDLRAGHEARAVGGEPQHDLAELARLGHVADRVTGVEERLALLAADHLPQQIEDRRVDAARMHRVAADVVLLLGAIERHALAQEPDRALARRVGERARAGLQAGD